MLLQFVLWYVVMTIVALAVYPLALRLFEGIPAGSLLALPLGVLLTGYLFWLGYSLGLLRNEAGGAWLALLAVAAVSAWLGRGWRARAERIEYRGVLVGELIFLVGFALWAWVRAHDPAADHTEEPMDLMFLSSLWASPTFPPQDAWLSGFPIGYYYGGYWLMTTLGRLTGTPPEISYTIGQAFWFGMLLQAAFAVGYALLRLPRARGAPLGPRAAALGGLLAALAVGVAGNVQAILEWLYAQGVNVDTLARWAQVRNFPDGARVTNNWYIATGEWWWWRTSRVIADQSLLGEHQEVIAEFPAFSYILGDNHPHVLGMPIAILLIALALAWWLRRDAKGAEKSGAEQRPLGEPAPSRSFRSLWMPSDPPLFAVSAIAVGSLLWINTWDFPAYWLLIVAAVWMGARERRWARAAATGLLLAGASLLLYLPYFLTAQSQANGIGVNFFNPTRLPQFLWIFLPALLALCALILLAWREAAPRLPLWGASVLGTLALPVLFLALAWWVVQATGGAARLPPLPETASGNHLVYLLGRWLSAPWVLLLVSLLLGTLIALLLVRAGNTARADPATTFALLLAALGLGLVYVPEFVYLRDNFGTRMNTVFKFYYQGWLLLGLSGSYAIVRALAGLRRGSEQGSEESGAGGWAAALPALPALLLIVAGLVFPAAAAWSRTNGFAGPPTFDATAYLQNFGAGELAAARWLRDTSLPNAVVAEAKGLSYRSDTSRISTLSGRPTLLGWEGHERQWRGDAYNAMAGGRVEALERLYRTGGAAEIAQLLAEWGIDYVVVGPAERSAYGLTPAHEERLLQVMDLVYDQADVRIYQRR